jgi:hypothetical protein
VKRQDKFGRKIFSESIWLQMQTTGNILLTLGYKESLRKPNLFYLENEFGLFFANMQGTEFVPIWDDPAPLIHWQFKQGIPNWKCRRLVKEEIQRLRKNNVDCRISYMIEKDPIFENAGGLIGEIELIWDDGFCHFCGKDFADEGAYCSEECQEKAFDQLRPTCPVCNKKICSNGVEHHLQYAPPEEKIFVHSNCHHKIHHTDMYPNLKPKDKSPYNEKKTRITKAMKEARLQQELEMGIAPDEYCVVCLKRYRKNDVTILYKGYKIHRSCIPKREVPKKGKFYFL